MGTLEPAASPVFRISRYFFSMIPMASSVMIGYAFRIGHVLPEEFRTKVWRIGFLKTLRVFRDRPRFPSTCDFPDPVSFEDVLRELAVSLSLRAIDHGEDDVKSGQKRGWQIDLFRNVLVFVESSELRVRRGKHRAP